MVSYNLGLTLLGNSGCRSDFFFLAIRCWFNYNAQFIRWNHIDKYIIIEISSGSSVKSFGSKIWGTLYNSFAVLNARRKLSIFLYYNGSISIYDAVLVILYMWLTGTKVWYAKEFELNECKIAHKANPSWKLKKLLEILK